MANSQTIELRPLTAVIGAEVSGVDLRQPLSSQQRDDIHEALMRHLVLFFRNQDLSEEQQLEFASNFGPPSSGTSSREETETMSGTGRPRRDGTFVMLEDTAESPPKADRWHTDVPFAPKPPDIAVLSMLVAPPVGGDTLWLNLYAVYEALSPTMQNMLSELDLDLDLGTTADLLIKDYGEEYYRLAAAAIEGARCPLVRVHPVTGRPVLFLCGSFMRGITGMHPDESNALLGFLRSRLDDPNVQCRWHWQQFDLAMWDERCTNHRAVSDHYPSRRLIRRCLVGEGVPTGLSGRTSVWGPASVAMAARP
jgi:taurine dioxygenase